MRSEPKFTTINFNISIEKMQFLIREKLISQEWFNKHVNEQWNKLLIEEFEDGSKVVVGIKSEQELKRGDVIIFELSRSKYVTVGKRYKINKFVRLDSGNSLYSFYDDRKKSRLMKFHTNGYLFKLDKNKYEL